MCNVGLQSMWLLWFCSGCIFEEVNNDQKNERPGRGPELQRKGVFGL